MFCAYARPRYQVSVDRTIGPLVFNLKSLFNSFTFHMLKIILRLLSISDV